MKVNSRRYLIVKDSCMVLGKLGIKTAKLRKKQTILMGNYMDYTAVGLPMAKC